jgi:hypothetical protein
MRHPPVRVGDVITPTAEVLPLIHNALVASEPIKIKVGLELVVPP